MLALGGYGGCSMRDGNCTFYNSPELSLALEDTAARSLSMRQSLVGTEHLLFGVG